MDEQIIRAALEIDAVPILPRDCDGGLASDTDGASDFHPDERIGLADTCAVHNGTTLDRREAELMLDDMHQLQGYVRRALAGEVTALRLIRAQYTRGDGRTEVSATILVSAD